MQTTLVFRWPHSPLLNPLTSRLFSEQSFCLSSIALVWTVVLHQCPHHHMAVHVPCSGQLSLALWFKHLTLTRRPIHTSLSISFSQHLALLSITSPLLRLPASSLLSWIMQIQFISHEEDNLTNKNVSGDSSEPINETRGCTFSL